VSSHGSGASAIAHEHVAVNQEKCYGALENEQVELRSFHVRKALTGALEALPLVLGDGFASDGDGLGVGGAPSDGHRGDLLPVVIARAARNSRNGNLGAYGPLGAGDGGHGAQACSPAGRKGRIHIGIHQCEQDHIAFIYFSDDGRRKGIGVIELLGGANFTSGGKADDGHHDSE